jgi:hypothetical protein
MQLHVQQKPVTGVYFVCTANLTSGWLHDVYAQNALTKALLLEEQLLLFFLLVFGVCNKPSYLDIRAKPSVLLELTQYRCADGLRTNVDKQYSYISVVKKPDLERMVVGLWISKICTICV